MVHYHLRGGGVSRVIEHAARAVIEAGYEPLVLIGEKPTLTPPCDVRVIDGLGYDADISPEDLVERLRAAAGEVVLWHVHNHSLGKNAALPGAIGWMAAAGERLVLQPHDFAEDGRPGNYRLLCECGAVDDLYPLAEHIHYATLNGRDRAALIAAGMPAERAHALPNAIDLAAAADAAATTNEGRLFLYPTRAIRRKNLGEFLLWAATADREAGDRFATTLAPTSAVDLPIYADWRELATRLNLPVEFEIGATSHASFAALVRSAHAMVTTSVAEGFGLAFLEPFLAGRPLVGRNLPDITADFARDGVNLDALYDFLGVPIAWVGEERLRDRVIDKLGATMKAYGRTCKAADIEAAMSAMTRGDEVDFGRLDEPMQRTVIERVLAEHYKPGVELNRPADAATIEHNRRVIASHYSLRKYGERLMGIYQRVLAARVTPIERLDAGKVLEQFLSPGRFNLLRT
ncbi:MAG: hypothetical protein GC162_20180 [Planctomycetes bacterium]|nr:hypothetical protein [Planctomycetota bacterium]